MQSALLSMLVIVTIIVSQTNSEKNSIDVAPSIDKNKGFVADKNMMRKENLTKLSKNHIDELNIGNQTKYVMRKCCEMGAFLNLNITRRYCEHNRIDNKSDYNVNNDYLIIGGVNTSEYEIRVGSLTGDECKNLNFSKNILKVELPAFKLAKNGNLIVTLIKGISQEYAPDTYCIDKFNILNVTKIRALVCTKEAPVVENHYALKSSCMLISCFFIILTVAVYAWIPELRNLHGMVLMAYLLCFFIGFLFLATMQILIIFNKNQANICTAFLFIIYYFLLAAFFWMNVMSYDIWWTFSGKPMSGKKNPRTQFLTYSIYAFSMPALLTILLTIIEFSVDPKATQYHPFIRRSTCFISGQSKLIYLYSPIVVMCVANLVFFILTALQIHKIKKQTRRLNRQDKQRFILYIKLYVVMGFTWIFEVISYFFQQANSVWMITDVYNILIGFFIFLIFICKENTWKLIKNRFRHMVGLPPLSRTQTTSTSISTRTISKEEMPMNSSSKY